MGNFIEKYQQKVIVTRSKKAEKNWGSMMSLGVSAHLENFCSSHRAFSQTFQVFCQSQFK